MPLCAVTSVKRTVGGSFPGATGGNSQAKSTPVMIAATTSGRSTGNNGGMRGAVVERAIAGAGLSSPANAPRDGVEPGTRGVLTPFAGVLSWIINRKTLPKPTRRD